MPNFNGTLKFNEVFASLYNMIISQRVFADNIATTNSTLVDMSRVDGTLYGDTKLYYASDVLVGYDWLGDDEAKNLLKLHRPKAPQVQAVTINRFRMIPITVDHYLSKRAFSTEGAFSQFNSVVLGWLRDTKRVYDATLFNSFVGSHSTLAENGKQNMTIALPAEPENGTEVNLEAYNRIVAQTIATDMANLLVDLADVTRDYNDYGNLRSYNTDDLVFVWNAEWVNKITKLDIPTIFNKEGLIDKFGQHKLPSRFFGNVNTTAGATSGANITVRSLIEKDYNTVEPSEQGYDPSLHVFPGDLLPDNQSYEANTTYGEDPSIICKVYHKLSIPFMTAFETGTEFFNPRSLS